MTDCEKTLICGLVKKTVMLENELEKMKAENEKLKLKNEGYRKEHDSLEIDLREKTHDYDALMEKHIKLKEINAGHENCFAAFQEYVKELMEQLAYDVDGFDPDYVK